MEEHMNKKIICTITTLTVCVMLTGCCMSHEWKEATCTEPKTCTKCGEIEGEALGHTWVGATCAEPQTCSVCGETEGETLAHTWVDATCSAPKTCRVCGETEGSALEHTLTEANYQQAATCEVCGETVGEPLQAYFEKYGLVCNAKLDTTYSLTIPCYNNNTYTTEAKYSFSDYEVFESDETHEALEGYEWRAVTYTTIYDDENALNYGATAVMQGTSDYYADDAVTRDENTGMYTINYNGVDYPEVKDDCEVLQYGWNNNNTIYTVQQRMYSRVPKGYDGIVVGLINPAIEWENLQDLADYPDDTIFFRLK